MEFQLASDLVGLAIGTKGAYIEEVRRRLPGTEVDFVRTGREAEGHVTVRVTGPAREDVARARELLELRKEQVLLTEDQRQFVVGQRYMLEEVRKSSGAHLVVLDRNTGALRLAGTAPALADARLLLEAQLEYAPRLAALEGSEDDVTNQLRRMQIRDRVGGGGKVHPLPTSHPIGKSPLLLLLLHQALSFPLLATGPPTCSHCVPHSPRYIDGASSYCLLAAASQKVHSSNRGGAAAAAGHGGGLREDGREAEGHVTVRVTGPAREDVARARELLELRKEQVLLTEDQRQFVVGQRYMLEEVRKSSGAHLVVLDRNTGALRLAGTAPALADARLLLEAQLEYAPRLAALEGSEDDVTNQLRRMQIRDRVGGGG
eukprot:CAMPEP_0194701886 /NCGR_PEP_ID=MMETSP0295-20121207/26516_1 /TAXON_ID=39354 /ORGANISM="Heterosigma akashiwo, Strain CCMP2393" /LENGTH=373 /DNA_ID=CAMNT_0039596289 /DNA_START=149 /DNA_END=1269 /DNA_ORIENTATION=+